MSKPCYVCKNETPVERLHYCMCDTAVCDKCINSVKNSDKTWTCPNCKNENDTEKSMLFRMT